MIKKFEAFTKNDLKTKDYFLNSLIFDKDYTPSEVQNIKKGDLSSLSKDDKLKYIKELLKSLKWQDLKVISESTDANEYRDIKWSLPEYIMDEIDSILPMEKHLYHFSFKIQDYNLFNRTHFEEGIHRNFRGVGLGYKLYKAVANHLGYISSADHNSSSEAQYIWSYLIKDPGFYTVLSKDKVLIVSKKMDKKEISDVVIRFIKKKIYSHMTDDVDTEVIKDIAKNNIVLRVDPELANDFRDINFHKLNDKIYNRWKQIIKSSIKNNLDSKFPLPFISQKVYNLKTNKENIITTIYTKNGKDLMYYLDGDWRSIKREDFIVIGDVSSNVDDLNVQQIKLGDDVIIDNKSIDNVYQLTLKDNDIYVNLNTPIGDVKKVNIVPATPQNLKEGDKVIIFDSKDKKVYRILQTFKTHAAISDGNNTEDQPIKSLKKLEQF